MIVKYTITTFGQTYESEIFLDDPTMENLKSHLKYRFGKYELVSSSLDKK